MKNSGFTLIEVLVSVLILSVGILGMTSMQMRALASNRDAMLRIEASQLVTDFIDRIESNDGSTYGPIALGDEPPTVTDCSESDCSPVSMAAYDITQWLCSINSQNTDGTQYSACNDLGIVGTLPSGQASVATIDDEYAIKVQWTEVKTNKTSSVQLFMQVPI
ncbi:MAG: type IV pilus modification protein PilV [bacterium]|nr:type IV pilus modification protein PilV [Gammaproteobacteria bacterium]HIL98504.1 type IV pilus modification protein PilV [Pseudomonadales bacterium]